VLTYAAKYPFKEIAGFDISQDLISIAQKNIQILKLENHIQVFTSDALQYNHYKKFDYFFLFNPFPSAIMIPTIQKIIESLEESPRKITIIYYNPTCHKDIMATGSFQLINELYDKIKDYKIYIYNNL
jgi:16S rRNA G966 N2-methylase RsmD